MKIDSKILREFVKKASLDGYIKTVNIDFRDEKIHSSVRDLSNIVLTCTELDSSVIENYLSIGEICIRDSQLFIKVLNTFKGDVDIKVKDNILIISNNTRSAYILLGSEIIADNVYRKDFPKLEWTSTFEISKEDLTKSVSDSRNIKTTKIRFIKEQDVINIETGEKNVTDYFINKIQTEHTGTGRVTVGDPIYYLHSVIGEKIYISLGIDIPVLFEEQSDNIKFRCLIAPIVESD